MDTESTVMSQASRYLKDVFDMMELLRFGFGR